MNILQKILEVNPEIEEKNSSQKKTKYYLRFILSESFEIELVKNGRVNESDKDGYLDYQKVHLVTIVL